MAARHGMFTNHVNDDLGAINVVGEELVPSTFPIGGLPTVPSFNRNSKP